MVPETRTIGGYEFDSETWFFHGNVIRHVQSARSENEAAPKLPEESASQPDFY